MIDIFADINLAHLFYFTFHFGFFVCLHRFPKAERILLATRLLNSMRGLKRGKR